MRKFTPKAGKDAYATGLYRYWLTRDVPGSEGLAAADGTTSKLKDMIFIGMKPSTADQHVDDPTVERCLDFARRFKCHRLIVLNLFACWREKEWSGDSIGPENDDFIREICDSSDGRDKLIIVGWGRDDRCKGRDEKVLELIRSVGGEVYCFRKNSDGSPSQPISLSPHVPDDFRPIPYP